MIGFWLQPLGLSYLWTELLVYVRVIQNGWPAVNECGVTGHVTSPRHAMWGGSCDPGAGYINIRLCHTKPCPEGFFATHRPSLYNLCMMVCCMEMFWCKSCCILAARVTGASLLRMQSADLLQNTGLDSCESMTLVLLILKYGHDNWLSLLWHRHAAWCECYVNDLLFSRVCTVDLFYHMSSIITNTLYL